MKIASLACAWPPYAGGIGNSAKDIAEILSEEHQVEIFHPDNMRPWLRRGHAAFAPQIFFKLRKFDYIYLHYPFFGTAEIVWLAKLFFKKPKLIIHYHMDVHNLSRANRLLSWPSRLIRFSLLNQAEQIVSASLDYIKNSQIKKYYAKRPDKFKEIPFSIDLDKFKPRDPKRPGGNLMVRKTKELINFINDKFIKRNKTEFIFVGGLDKAHYFKGVKQMIMAFAGITGDWRLNIVGDGDLRGEYEKLSESLNLNQKIHFSGKLSDDDLRLAYRDADCLILPSINSNEAFGIVIIEALASGLAVIASDLPGVRRVFENYKEGLLFEAGNIEDMQRKIKYLLENKNMRQLMSVAARDLAEKKYDSEKIKIKIKSLIS